MKRLVMIKKIPESWKTLVILAFSLFGFDYLEDFCHSIFTALKIFFDMTGTYPWFNHLHFLLSILVPLTLMKWTNMRWTGNSESQAKSLLIHAWKFILLAFGLVMLCWLLRALAIEFGSSIVIATKGSLIGPLQQADFESQSTLSAYYFMTFIGPLREELCYRSLLLQRLINRCSKRAALTVSSAIFVFIHLPSLNWQKIGSLVLLKIFLVYDAPYLLLMGCVFGLVFIRYGFFAAFFIHALTNILSINRVFLLDHFDFLFPTSIIGIILIILEIRHFTLSARTTHR